MVLICSVCIQPRDQKRFASETFPYIRHTVLTLHHDNYHVQAVFGQQIESVSLLLNPLSQIHWRLNLWRHRVLQAFLEQPALYSKHDSGWWTVGRRCPVHQVVHGAWHHQRHQQQRRRQGPTHQQRQLRLNNMGSIRFIANYNVVIQEALLTTFYHINKTLENGSQLQ